MATTTRRRRRAQKADPTPDGPTYIPALAVSDIVPYEFNPRDNEAAIQALKESIKEFGFLIPVVVDSSNVLAAGHTRVEAAKELGLTHVPAVLADHLTPEQIRAFRLIDNKVAELSTWNIDLLSGEITALMDSGVDLTAFWTQEELDCLTEVVGDDCLTAGEIVSEVGSPIRPSTTGSRAPERTRVVVGEFVFHLPKDVYRLWANEVKEENDFEEARIIADLQARLGMTRYLSNAGSR